MMTCTPLLIKKVPEIQQFQDFSIIILLNVIHSTTAPASAPPRCRLVSGWTFALNSSFAFGSDLLSLTQCHPLHYSSSFGSASLSLSVGMDFRTKFVLRLWLGLIKCSMSADTLGKHSVYNFFKSSDIRTGYIITRYIITLSRII